MARSKTGCEDCPVLVLMEVGKAFVDVVRSALPEEIRGHLLTARKEMLLAFRSAIDYKLKELESKGKRGKKRATRIKVK
jgi:hypothetical protein